MTQLRNIRPITIFLLPQLRNIRPITIFLLPQLRNIRPMESLLFSFQNTQLTRIRPITIFLLAQLRNIRPIKSLLIYRLKSIKTIMIARSCTCCVLWPFLSVALRACVIRHYLLTIIVTTYCVQTHICFMPHPNPGQSACAVTARRRSCRRMDRPRVPAGHVRHDSRRRTANSTRGGSSLQTSRADTRRAPLSLP